MKRQLLAAGLALLLSAGGVRAGGLGQQVTPRADALSVATTTSVRSLFVAHCAGCHGRDGAGSAVGNVPDMRRLGVFLHLEGGRDFIIKVPGVMGSGLDDRQVAEVTNWVLATLARGSEPAGQPLYGEAEVARARARPLLDVAAERSRLVTLARAQNLALN